MIIGTICVHGVRALTVSAKPIPRGIIGAQVQFEYADPMWDGLSKTVVFRAGDVTKDVLNAGELVDIPPEVVTEVGEILKVGVYGEGIPTLWADLGRIRDATDPSGDESTDPSLPVWVQLQEQIDDLKKAGVSEEKIAQVVNDYLQKNPPTVTETDPTVPAWAKNKEKPKYTADEVGALSKTELSGAVNDALAQAKASGEFKGDPGYTPVKGKDYFDGQPGYTPQKGVDYFDGDDYVLTPDDKTEIAKLAADLVEVPDSGGNVAYDEAQNLTDEQKAQARENIGAQPAGNYLTEVPEGYAKTEDIPTDAEIIQLIEEHAPESSGGGIAVTGATVGQTVKIAEVDENGVPTAWLPADFPSGGSGKGYKWELIAEGTVAEEARQVDINKDVNGEDFELICWYLYFILEPCENDKTQYVHTKVNGVVVGTNTSANADKVRYYQSFGEVIGGYNTVCAQSCSNLNYNNTWSISNFAKVNLNGSNAKKISIDYGQANVAGANSKYVLYGVRA